MQSFFLAFFLLQGQTAVLSGNIVTEVGLKQWGQATRVGYQKHFQLL
jgi:CO/xanthine dehydrogenase FAD-binding subunit